MKQKTLFSICLLAMACVGFMATSCEPEKPDTILQQKPQRPTEQPPEPFPPKRMERWVQIGQVSKIVDCDGNYTMEIYLPIFYGGGSLAHLEDVRRTSLIMDWEHMTFKNYSTFYDGQYYGLVTGPITFVDNENIADKFSTVTFDPHLSWQAYDEAYFYQNWEIVWFGDYTSPDKNHPFWYSDAVREKLQELHIQWNLPVNQFAVLHNNEADFRNSTMYFVVFPYSE